MLLKQEKSIKPKRMMILTLMVFAIMIGILNTPFNQLLVHADDSNPTKADFFVQPFFDNGASAGADYKNHPYSLWYDNVKPGSDVRVTVLITNQSKDARNFQVSANTAYTNVSGTIAYGLEKPKMDTTQKVDFHSLFKNNKVKVKVPGTATNNGQVAVSLVAKIPESNFKGTVTGGMNVYAYDPTEKQKTKQTSLVNKFSYVIPVTFNINCAYRHNEFMSKDTMKIGGITPYAQMVGHNGQASMVVTVRNTKPATLSNMRTNTVITKKDNSKIRGVSNTEGSQMAPNSVWQNYVNWGDQAIQAGDYHLTMKVKVDGDGPVSDKTSVSKNYTWKYDKDFTITGSQANQLNRQMGIKPNYTWLWITLGVLVVILLILVVWYFARRTKKNNSV